MSVQMIGQTKYGQLLLMHTVNILILVASMKK